MDGLNENKTQNVIFGNSVSKYIDGALGPLSALCKTNVKNLGVYLGDSFKVCR